MTIVTKSSRVSVSPGIDDGKIKRIESCIKSFIDEIDSEISCKNILVGETIKITLKSKIVYGYHDVYDETTTILTPSIDWGNPIPSEVQSVICNAIQVKLGPEFVAIISPSDLLDEFVMFNIYFAEKSAIMPFPGTEVEE